MDEQQQPDEQQQRQERIARAERIALGIEPGPQSPCGETTVALKDYSARGSRRQHWFRMAWNGSAWAYMGDRRLAAENVRAADRHDSVRGEVYEGLLTVTHDRGGPVDREGQLWLSNGKYVETAVAKRRDGTLEILLPSGATIVTPNPRAR